MMAGEEMSFSTGSPFGQENSVHVVIGGSENFRWTSNFSLQAVQMYS